MISFICSSILSSCCVSSPIKIKSRAIKQIWNGLYLNNTTATTSWGRWLLTIFFHHGCDFNETCNQSSVSADFFMFTNVYVCIHIIKSNWSKLLFMLMFFVHKYAYIYVFDHFSQYKRLNKVYTVCEDDDENPVMF